MRTFLIPGSFALLFFVGSVSAQPVISYTPVITGLSSPIQLVNAGDLSKRIFIVEKLGSIQVFDSAYVSKGTFLTVTGITSSGERGLMSMVFHPQYSSNGFFYVYYTNGNGDLELARYHVSSDPDIADETSKKILITIPHPTNTNHNGGELHFGNDGFLYLSTGDGGGGGDVPNNAQNTNLLLGKMLRFDVNTSDTPPYYSLPVDNPYDNEIFAVGLRNPFRWSFDRLTYDMWIGDVGQDSREEINYRPFDSTRNVNYGWRCYEGNIIYNNSGTGCGQPIENYNFPVYDYTTPSPSGAVTGGTVYRGNTYIDLRGYYIGADFFTGIVYRVLYNSSTYSADTYPLTPSPLVTGLADFGETEDGELYAVSLFANTVYRITSDGPIGYTFIGNGNWDIADNWSNSAIPPSTLPAGAEILIDPVAGGEAVLNTVQTVAPGAKFNVKSNKNLRIVGDLVIQ